jgi:hypothetical protein
MDRRTKFILLVIFSILLLGLVFWFIIYPLIRPAIQEAIKAQPPSPTAPQSPVVSIPGGQEPGAAPGTNGPGPGAVEVTPELSPDEQRIIELSRIAGILSERILSGSSADGFSNYDDAALDVASVLAEKLRTLQAEMRNLHPASGATYLTVARRLREVPEDAKVIRRDTFVVRVELQVQIEDAGVLTVEMRETTFTFTRQGSKWLATDFSEKLLEL